MAILITNATAYPAYPDADGKKLFITDFEDAIEQGNKAQLREVLYKLCNTEPDGWDDQTATVDHDA
jgi:hypothetical protein